MIGWSNMGAGSSLGFSIHEYPMGTDFNNITGVENEIAIATDTSISEYAFLNELPQEFTNNGIVVLVGHNDDFSFNIIDKINILVYPYSVFQYINNEWVNRISKIWHNGSWVDLNQILFDDGMKAELWEINTSVYNNMANQSFRSNGGVTSSYVRNIIYVNYSVGSCWTGCWAGTKNIVNKGSYTTLNFNLTLTDPGTSATGGAWLMLASTKEGNLSGKTYLIQQLLTDGTITVDISSITDDFYIFFNGGQNCSSDGKNTKITLTKIWLA